MARLDRERPHPTSVEGLARQDIGTLSHPKPKIAMTPSLLRSSYPTKVAEVGPRYVHIWEFEVLDEKVEEFLLHYGDAGTWAALFGRSRGYLGTKLLRSRARSGRFLTIDAWQSESAFDEFLSRFGREYELLDLACEPLTKREVRLGSFLTSTSPISLCSGVDNWDWDPAC